MAEGHCVKITHEQINSLGVLLGILLGSAGLWLQLKPKAEDLTLDAGELMTVDEVFKPRLTAPLPLGNRTLVGPLYWKVMINNRSERPVSLKRIDVLLNDSRAGTYMVSGAFEGIYQDDLRTPALPLTLPAYETRSVVVKGYLPGWISSDAQAKCLRKGISVHEFSRCSMGTGTDMFGNKLQVMKDGDRFLGAAWPVDAYNPKFVITFTTGSDHEFKTSAAFIPAVPM